MRARIQERRPPVNALQDRRILGAESKPGLASGRLVWFRSGLRTLARTPWRRLAADPRSVTRRTKERVIIVDISTTLECSLDEAIAHVKTPRLLEFVAAPLVRFVPVSPPSFPEAWSVGEYSVALRLFGVVPFGEQAIVISMPPTDTGFAVRDAGSSALINTWDHLITITPHGSGCRYRDRVEVRAGLLTPFVWLFARLFYRHRQRRWRALVARSFDYGAA